MLIKPKIVVDTNIFIKAWFKNDESCNVITDLIDRKRVKLLFSQETIGELIYISKKYVIKYMSSEIPRMAILNNVVQMFYNSKTVDTSKTRSPRIRDKEDEMFVKCAIEGNVDFLISNDFRSGMHKLTRNRTRVVGSDDFVNIYKEIYEIKKEIAISK